MKLPLAEREYVPSSSVPWEVIEMVRRFAVVCGMVAALITLVVVGYPEDWNQFPAPNSPTERFGQSMVVLDDGRVLSFGGEDVRGELINDLHVFKNNRWSIRSTQDSPPARFGATLTQISKSEVALFGGMGEDGVLNDLWILDTETWEWRRVAGDKAPPPRKFHSAWCHGGTLYVAGGVGADGKPRRDLYRYYIDENAWDVGPYAPEDFWGAYATVSCESPCSAVILGPVSLLYDLAGRTWHRLTAKGDVPPKKYLATFARRESTVEMFGGLYRSGDKVYSTPCHYSYDLVAKAWTYHHGVPSPFEDTGLWGANAFWDENTGGVYVYGGLQGFPFDRWEAFIESGLKAFRDRDVPKWPWNDKVYVMKPSDQPPSGRPGRVPGQPPGGGGQPPAEPEEPKVEVPFLKQCLITDALDENSDPVHINPTITGANDAVIFWYEMKPLCDKHATRLDVYDASGRLYMSIPAETINPKNYGVSCINRYQSSLEVPLPAPGNRPLGRWWVQFYIDEELACTVLFRVEP